MFLIRQWFVRNKLLIIRLKKYKLYFFSWTKINFKLFNIICIFIILSVYLLYYLYIYYIICIFIIIYIYYIVIIAELSRRAWFSKRNRIRVVFTRMNATTKTGSNARLFFRPMLPGYSFGSPSRFSDGTSRIRTIIFPENNSDSNASGIPRGIADK